MTRSQSVAALTALLISPLLCGATPATRSLVDLSLEELSEISVTAVSRREESLSGAAASIYVITADDIRRAGATSLPEALRLAPNLQVARIDAAQYAVSARGFNNAIGNKLLVLIDGRTVYAPFFSGVQWDQQDVMLEDVDRIEVISGPGATLWGANAVNGVINVVTLPASRTQGALAAVAGGTESNDVALRYGGPLGADGHFRVYAKSSELDSTETEAGTEQPDDWERLRAGFRADWSSDSGGFMLQGQAMRAKSGHRGSFGATELTPVELSEANLLARWTRRLSGGSDMTLQGYYNHSQRDDVLIYQPHEDVFDVEFQHGLQLGSHRLQWGAGYRRAKDHLRPGVFFGFVPSRRTLSWKSLYVQDEVRVGPTAHLTVGAKLEHNEYTGTEVLPTLRWAWRPSADGLVWAAVSRAVRAPARLDRDIVLPPRPPYIIAGGPDFVSEVAVAYELGYRATFGDTVTFSATAFHHEWDRLRSGQTPPDAQVQNRISGHTRGVEAWGVWQPAPGWRLSGGATTLHKRLRLDEGSTDPVGASNLGNDPEYQVTLRSAWTLPHGQEVDLLLRHVGALPEPRVPAYTAVDLRYGWRMAPGLEFAVVGRNLFDSEHPEFGAEPDRSEIARSVMLQLRWQP